MAHDVFVSYSSFDKATADAVCALLEARGIRCWIAPRDILPGVSWAEAIIDAIEASRVMVLIFSARANASQQIQREVERAVHNGVTIVPLRIEDAKPSKTMEYFISTPHWLDALTPPLESHIQRLADGLKTLLSRPDTREAISASVKLRAYQMGQASSDAPPPPPATSEPSVFSAPAQAPAAAVPPPQSPVAVPARPEPVAPRPREVERPVAVAPPRSVEPPRAIEPVPVSPAPVARSSSAPVAARGGLSGLQIGIAAGVVLLLAAVIAGLMMRTSPGPETAATAPASNEGAPAGAPASPATDAKPATAPGTTPAAAPAAGLTMVTIDAAPWAHVKITPVGGGTAPTGELVTPLTVQLAPGEYDVTFDNGGVTSPLTKRITVAANLRSFRYTMPGFVPAKVVQDLRASEGRP